jgi:hypothetical protein
LSERAAMLVERVDLRSVHFQSPSTHLQSVEACAHGELLELVARHPASQGVDLEPLRCAEICVGNADELGCARAPTRRRERLAAELPVAGERCSLAVELIGIQVFDRTRDVGMDALATLPELRLVGDLVGEGMLECVFAFRVDGLLENQLGSRQSL